MKTPTTNRLILRCWPLLALLVLGLAGCSDDPTDPGTIPDAEKAAELTAGVQGPATVGGTMNDLDMFRNPLSSLSEDAGIYQETPVDGDWGGDVTFDYPSKAAMAAAGFRGAKTAAKEARVLTAAKGAPLARLARKAIEQPGKAAGDTVAVVYYDTADSTGLDALIETDETDILRLVSQRAYAGAGPLQIAMRSTEIVLDSNGTVEDGADDVFHAVSHSSALGNGETTTAELAPVAGPGPMEPGVEVRAYQRVDDPSFHILQEWHESELILDPGDFQTDGDEAIHSLVATVHWRNGAEHTASIAPVAGGAILPDEDVRAVGAFTARPNNLWLETTADTLRVRLGDLEDDTDDLLYEISRAAVFDGVAADGGQPRSYVHMLPDEPAAPGDEPCGGEALQDIHYPSDWWLSRLTRSADIECDGSGTLTVDMTYRDGSSFTRTITWDGQGAGTVTENRIDGTVVTGSFDETTGAYALTTTYPAGHDPVSRDRHGTALEGSVEAWEIVVWQDAHPDTTYFTAVESGGETTASGYRVDGDLREDFSLVHDEDGNASGEWTRNDGAEGEFELEMLEGGGSHLVFAASDPAAEGSPSVTGEIYYAPDGSGTGTVTFTQNGNSVTYTVTFGPDGAGTLEDGAGNTVPL